MRSIDISEGVDTVKKPKVTRKKRYLQFQQTVEIRRTEKRNDESDKTNTPRN